MASVATVFAVFATGRASADASTHATLLLATTGASVFALWLGLRRRRDLLTWVIGGIVATLAVALLAGALLSRPTTIDEDVVRATPDAMEREATPTPTPAPAPAGNVLLASGSFQPLEHAGRGTASVISTPDGRNVLTLTDFRTDAGPDLFVLLVPNDPTDDDDVERAETVNLGKLKATGGDQQYVLPTGVDPTDYTHAYVWCRAFSVGFTRAPLG